MKIYNRYIYIYIINIYVIYNTYNILYIPDKLCIELQQSVQLVEWFTSNKSWKTFVWNLKFMFSAIVTYAFYSESLFNNWLS